ncbi:magnesium transporter [Corynebacterium felinum]|uniref:General stress protein 17M-like domain-containing protein n=1 Tax=Corynebacterium felinum TaxID=131318 RepID=A0ABU2BAE2_9CORY|nr:MULTISPECIES: general stress protein [Corynebacterium]MDF5821126.1 magnesium transporter [Corynebacterium felinum]MDO4762270.1 magnesium transporter [Corynebacterium sp.]MDR7355256.1 hypothetical protein [Corynebacterium felinum]
MSSMFPAKSASARQRPEGWPVGSFQSYEQAQAAVDMLSDNKFDVKEVTIVGVDLMEVEKVLGRLTWGRVLIGGAASGAWLGLFFGTMMGIVTGQWASSLLLGMSLGVVFYTGLSAAQYAAQQGKRDFASTTEIVATRYDVLCTPSVAPKARDLIGAFVAQGGRAKG